MSHGWMQETTALVARDLFGGAVRMAIPAHMVDVSDSRPVPDNQEVWADSDDTDRSIVFEIMEHHECADEDCSTFFFNELATLNDSQATVVLEAHNLGPNELPGFAGTSGVFACLVLGTQVVAKTGQDKEAGKVVVSLAVLRLPQVGSGSDVLISLNVPVQDSDMASAEQPNLLAVNSLMHQMLESLHIQDWGLFGS